MKRTYPPVFIFDIETTNLDANRGHILCAAGKWLGSKEVLTWDIASDNGEEKGWGSTVESWEDDSEIILHLKAEIEKAKAVVAYYGGYMKFDVPFVNTRLMRWGMPPLKQLAIVDPFQMAKSKLKLARNSMDAVSTLLGCKHRKTHVDWEKWNRAKFGDRKALKELLKYNINDVVVLEEVYLKMLPLFPNHPLTGNVSSTSDSCRACGGATYSKGWRYLAKTRVHDVVCKVCGWRGDGRKERL